MEFRTGSCIINCTFQNNTTLSTIKIQYEISAPDPQDTND